jgi:AraC family transcriptional regulator
MASNDRNSLTNQPGLGPADYAASDADGGSVLRKPAFEGASEEVRHRTVSLLGRDNHIGAPFEVLRIANDIYRNVQRSPESARAAALQLVGLLTPPPMHTRGGLAPWQKRKVDKYVCEHLQEHIRVVELANEIPLSVSYFHRVFKETFGETPRTYITRMRLELAQELMLRTEERLTQIALAAGFANQSHLSKTFRRVMTETPSAWRRRNVVDARVDTRTSRVLHDGLSGL